MVYNSIVLYSVCHLLWTLQEAVFHHFLRVKNKVEFYIVKVSISQKKKEIDIEDESMQ